MRKHEKFLSAGMTWNNSRFQRIPLATVQKVDNSGQGSGRKAMEQAIAKHDDQGNGLLWHGWRGECCSHSGDTYYSRKIRFDI